MAKTTLKTAVPCSFRKSRELHRKFSDILQAKRDEVIAQEPGYINWDFWENSTNRSNVRKSRTRAWVVGLFDEDNRVATFNPVIQEAYKDACAKMQAIVEQELPATAYKITYVKETRFTYAHFKINIFYDSNHR